MPQIAAGAFGGAQEGVQGLLKPMQEEELLNKKQAYLLQQLALKQSMEKSGLQKKFEFIKSLDPSLQNLTPQQDAALALKLGLNLETPKQGFSDVGSLLEAQKQKAPPSPKRYNPGELTPGALKVFRYKQGEKDQKITEQDIAEFNQWDAAQKAGLMKKQEEVQMREESKKTPFQRMMEQKFKAKENQGK